jgi:hypothetical protein
MEGQREACRPDALNHRLCALLASFAVCGDIRPRSADGLLRASEAQREAARAAAAAAVASAAAATQSASGSSAESASPSTQPASEPSTSAAAGPFAALVPEPLRNWFESDWKLTDT